MKPNSRNVDEALRILERDNDERWRALAFVLREQFKASGLDLELEANQPDDEQHQLLLLMFYSAFIAAGVFFILFVLSKLLT